MVMARVAISVLLVILLAATVVPGQPHGHGWIFTAAQSAPAPALGRIAPQGTMSTLVTQSVLGGTTRAVGGAMSAGNSHHLVAITSTAVHQSLLIVDGTGKIIRTLTVSPLPPSQGGYVTDVVMDQDGDFIVLEGPGGGQSMALYRLDQQLNLTTLHSGSPLIRPAALTVDIDTGDFMVLDPGRLYRVKPDGSSITTVGLFRVPVLGQVTQDIATGDFFAGSNLAQEPGAVIVRMTAGGTASTFLGAGFGSCTAVAADRASAPASRLAFAVPGGNAGVYFVDVASRAITTLLKGPNLGYTHLWPDRGNNLSTTRMTGKLTWTLALDFPGDGGLAYAVGLSVTGVRPVLPLPDGRRIPLVLDALTPLSLSGRLAPIFTGHAGRLDPAGAATATLNSLPAFQGLRLWAIALTLDPQAPLGIRTISDPVVLNL